MGRWRLGRRARFVGWMLLLWILLAAAVRQVSAAPEATPEQVAMLLAAMHPGYERYIARVRYGPTRLRPAAMYAGLVRRGGLDPRNPDDGPVASRGASFDLIVYADTFEPWRTPAWRRLVADHEFFHARHLAHSAGVPVVGFGVARADSDWLEALAWGHVLGEAASGVYGDLSAIERAEAGARYAEHRDRFMRFVMEKQPSAWDHYGRFLPSPEIMATNGPARPAAAVSWADPATR